jgi:parallel beta-helix repeat protein
VLTVLSLVVSCRTAPKGDVNRPTARPFVPRVELWVSPTGRDDDPGTKQRPLRQVQRAAVLAGPGTLVHVAAGIYAAVVTTRSGTADAPIVFRSEGRWQAAVDAGGGMTAWTNTGNWVRIEGFDLDGSTYNGILSTGSHARFTGNHVHDIRSPNCSRGGAGIVVESYVAVDNITADNVVERVVAPGDCGMVHGIYYQSPDGGRIVNNLVSGCSGWGIHLWHNASRIAVTNNTVVHNARGGIAVGGSLEGNDLPPGIASGVIVSNNIVADNGEFGISETGRVGKNTFAENLSHGNALADYRLAGGRAPDQAVSGDPQFLNPNSDYRLRFGSPALDAGDPAVAPSEDLDGTPRPTGPGIDLGAYEGAH